jgi:hypothetical protein
MYTKGFLKYRKPGLFVNIGPECGSAFPIWIRIQESQIDADPCGSGSTTLNVPAFLSQLVDNPLDGYPALAGVV